MFKLFKINFVLILSMSTGIIVYNNQLENFYVNQLEVVEMNTALLNDEVSITKEGIVEKILKRDETEIYGILKLTSRVKQGSNKRGIPIYLFKPYHHKYPSFLVCSRRKPKKNIFCSITFNKWDSIRKIHFGKMDKIIGEVGNYDNEIQYIIACNGLNYIRNNKMVKDYRLKEKIEEDIKLDCELQDMSDEEYEKKWGLDVISIDPEGCKDVDDAFRFHDLFDKQNFFLIEVYIADPLTYMDDRLFELMKQRFFTIYYDGGKNNMLPDIYAEELSSLREGKKRWSLSVRYSYCCERKAFVKMELNRYLVRNIKAYSYDEADKIMKKGRWKNKADKMLIGLKKFMINHLGYENVNSHDIIEFLMITANTDIGNLFFERFQEKLIVRSHPITEKINLDEIEDENLKKYLDIRSMKKASYNFASKDNENYHFGLDLNNYVHFTSPIRRFNDMLIHYLYYQMCGFKKRFTDFEITQELLGEMNDREKKINKCERKLNKLRIIKELENDGDFEKEVDGFITEFNDKYLVVYIPSIKLEEKIRLIPRKFAELYNVEISDREVVLKKDEEVVSKFKLYEKVKLNITTFLNEEIFNNKIRINVI